MTNIIQDELTNNVLDEMGNAILDETSVTPTPGVGKNPTGWNFNPLASTTDLINYDVATEKYDTSTQPYDGYASNTPSPNTPKNPTAYTPLSVLYQQYYGGPTTVPLYAAPSHWVANPGEINQAGQYIETDSAEANLYPYDQGTREYDNNNPKTDYDGTNGNLSFSSWKNPSQWTPITGGSL
jgi:hypothetical protein